MTDTKLKQLADGHPWLAGAVTIAGSLSLATVIVLFAWNSFAVPVLDLTRLRFKEALGLTLLVAVVGHLLVPQRAHAHRSRHAQP